jgi:hypothetical protein
MTILIGTLVSVPPLEIVAETPTPLTITAFAPARLNPFRVAETVCPWNPEGVEMPVSSGAPLPFAVTARTRLLPYSAIKTFPSGSTAIPSGDLIVADAAGIPSASESPPPMIVRIAPAASTPPVENW